MKSRFIDRDELSKVRKAVPDELWLPFRVALETGLRVGDVVKIKRKDIKPDGIHYIAEKTGKKGVAPISASLRQALKKGAGEYCFPSPTKRGCHITRQALWSRLKKAGQSAGVDLDGVSPHALRKVFAVETYREKGFAAVKNALQHTNSLTTEVYSFADWDTGENANKPLTRRDLKLIVRMVIEALGEGIEIKTESKEKRLN